MGGDIHNSVKMSSKCLTTGHRLRKEVWDETYMMGLRKKLWRTITFKQSEEEESRKTTEKEQLQR